MTDSSTLGFAQAAQALGVSISVLRRAIRNGKIPAPANAGVTAVAPLSAEWLASVQAAAKGSRDCFKQTDRRQVPAFARYEGTSAWRKYHRRVREYNHARKAAA